MISIIWKQVSVKRTFKIHCTIVKNEVWNLNLKVKVQCILGLIVPDLEQTCQILVRSRSGTLPKLARVKHVGPIFIS